jgi:hypothetical protein
MSKHIDNLTDARDRMVEERRGVASELAKPYSAEKTPKFQRMIVEIQQAIDAIDRALRDEEKLLTQAPIKEHGEDDAYRADE